MQHSKIIISLSLDALAENLKRTQDPLGVKSTYWTYWADDMSLASRDTNLIYTARMYQMLPYAEQLTKMVAKFQPGIALLSFPPFFKLSKFAEHIAVSPYLRLSGLNSRVLRGRVARTLKGITFSLKFIGINPMYLYDEEPYSGVLLHDLGMEDEARSIATNVFDIFKKFGVKTVFTVDPHTTFMLRQVYPGFQSKFDIRVKHYLEVISQSDDLFNDICRGELPSKVVIHDSCVMARDLRIIEEPRNILANLGIEALDPENAGLDTACCGGPIEYAYKDLSSTICYIRARELAHICSDIVVTCPICLINLMKYEKELGIRVWDLGEILFNSLKYKIENKKD